MIKMSQVIKQNINDSYKNFKNNCLWFNDKTSIWYQKDNKYQTFSLEQWIDNTIKHYFNESNLMNSRLDFNIDKGFIIDTYTQYWNSKQYKQVA